MDGIIEKLGLEPHPERGYYRETYRAPAEVQSPRHDGSRAASTAIYFFVTANEPTTFLHRLVSDEIFHLYDGGPLEIVRLFEDGRWDVAVLGMNLDEGERPQIVIPAGTWFGTELRADASHCLVGCTVAPGFDFADFELAQGPELEARYPEAAERIRRMSRRRSLVSGRHERGELRRAGAGWSRFGDTMNVSDAISTRRSIKRFTSRPVTREEIETLLSAAVAAPNHRLTQPWRFYVLGPEARQAYGLVLGERKARKIEDPDAARAMRDTVAAEHRALPAMLIVAAADNDNPEIKEEDYAAVMMAIQNLSLAAVALGLGTHVKTGAVMSDPGARAAAGVKDNQRIVAVVNIGEPAEIPAEKKREPATAFTTWQP